MADRSDTQAGSPPDRIIDRHVGNFVVEKKLGEGGMGAVYRLKHTRLPNTYAALKIMSAELGDSVELRRRFDQEAMVAATIGSHRVVKVLDIGEFPDGIPYIQMEYVEGQSLQTKLDHEVALPLREALTIALRVADTMVIAHQHGVVHRDLKPDNVMLVREGNDLAVKIIDFGVARATGEAKLAVTQNAAVIGTAGYFSPEAAAGLPADGRSDVFSLGVVLYEMLTGNLPFPAPTVRQALGNLLMMPTPSAAANRPAELDPVPAEVDEIISEALAKEPSDRLTMLAFHKMLASIIDGLQENSSPVRSLFRTLRGVGHTAASSPTLATPPAESPR